MYLLVQLSGSKRFTGSTVSADVTLERRSGSCTPHTVVELVYLSWEKCLVYTGRA
ncbi:MAG TPA: hypothetical protein VI542_31925 [Candidatus Tectomicrobia bacterium]